MELIALFGFWFWVAVIASFALTAWALEYESGIGTTVAVVASIAALWYFTGATIVPWYAFFHTYVDWWKLPFVGVLHVPLWLHLITLLVLYLFFGAVYTVIKWQFYTWDAFDHYETDIKPQATKQYEELQDKYSKRDQAKVVGQSPLKTGDTFYVTTTDSSRDTKYSSTYTWYEDYKSFVADKYKFPPVWSLHKAQLGLWLAYWPWSALWTLTANPLKRIKRAIIRGLGGVYSGITARAMKNHPELQ